MITAKDMAQVKRQLAALQALVASLEARMIDRAQPREVTQALAGARRALLPQAYINNTAWDILLDLDVAQRSGEQRIYPIETDHKRPSAETLLRYLSALEADEMISLSPDGCGSYSVALTPVGSARLEQIFAAALAATPAACAA